MIYKPVVKITLLVAVVGLSSLDSAQALEKGSLEVSEQYKAIVQFIPDVIKNEAEVKRAACILRIIGLQKRGYRSFLSPEEMAQLAVTSITPPRDSIDGVNINIKCQYGYYQENGEILKIFIVSTGRKGLDTKIGTFKIHYQYNGWWESTLYPGSLMYRPKYFYKGMALHGLKYDSSVHTYAASHGCVRVTKNTINYLWKVMKKDTLVRVSGV